jgi:hypothetical protein
VGIPGNRPGQIRGLSSHVTCRPFLAPDAIASATKNPELRAGTRTSRTTDALLRFWLIFLPP